jgi:hypothetical protein
MTSLDDIAARASQRLKAHDPVLADLVLPIAAVHQSQTEHLAHRARLDAYLAMMAAETARSNAESADKTARSNAEASDKIAKRLVVATWALVLATLGLLVITAVAAT